MLYVWRAKHYIHYEPLTGEYDKNVLQFVIHESIIGGLFMISLAAILLLILIIILNYKQPYKLQVYLYCIFGYCLFFFIIFYDPYSLFTWYAD